jgi:hypothetical protein
MAPDRRIDSTRFAAIEHRPHPGSNGNLADSLLFPKPRHYRGNTKAAIVAG